ncbi:hypothetical protein [Streptomyces sp. CAU 1734]|uniref:hypothetical protein n=1 Tax=Streptomyces sp. CAU 1734 TaxID=3140360 RepID=UPI00325FF905
MDRQSGSARLDTLLASAHEGLGIAVYDSLMSQGGPPEPRDPDRALGRLLAGVHRQTLAAVVRRTDWTRWDEQVSGRGAGPGGGGRGAGGLMRRLASVRLKYRAEALRIARSHWPHDLDELILGASGAVEELLARLEEAECPPEGARDALAEVDLAIGRVLALPEPPVRPAAPVGRSYPELVSDLLGGRAARLLSVARNCRTLLELELELLPRPGGAGGGRWSGALEVAQDLADDLELAHREAVALRVGVSLVHRAAHDFRGADLHAAQLEGVRLEGIRWDSGTVWPPGWEDRIRRASLAAGDVLVVGSEPYDSAVAADI